MTNTSESSSQMRPSMKVKIGSLEMKNPITTASGTFAVGRQYKDFVNLESLGAITTKGVSATPWEGNASPRITETPSGMLNSIGLQNPGVEDFCKSDLAWLAKQNVPIIVNVSGHSVKEYRQVIERLEKEGVVGAYELNVSCPNVDSGGMTFGIDPESIKKIVTKCKKATNRPIIVKLTPNITDITITAKAAEEAGADAISLINTLLGMAIDVKSKRAVLARKVGGLSGPAIKPIALRMVYEVYRAVSIPIIGMGGITSTQDAIEFMLAGASAVAVGTANFTNPRATLDIVEGLEKWCIENDVSDVRVLTGALLD